MFKLSNTSPSPEHRPIIPIQDQMLYTFCYQTPAPYPMTPLIIQTPGCHQTPSPTLPTPCAPNSGVLNPEAEPTPDKATPDVEDATAEHQEDQIPVKDSYVEPPMKPEHEFGAV